MTDEVDIGAVTDAVANKALECIGHLLGRDLELCRDCMSKLITIRASIVKGETNFRDFADLNGMGMTDLLLSSAIFSCAVYLGALLNAECEGKRPSSHS